MHLIPDINPHKPDPSNYRRCTICGGDGPALPTGCPGRPMTDEERDDARSGNLNFFDGDFTGFQSERARDRSLGNILTAWLILIPPIADLGGEMMGDNAWLLFSAAWIVALTAAMIYVAFG